MPPDFEHGSKGLFDWSVKIHNLVNTQLHKEEMPLEEARDLYTAMKIVKVDKKDRQQKIVYVVVGILCLSTIIYVAFYMSNSGSGSNTGRRLKSK